MMNLKEALKILDEAQKMAPLTWIQRDLCVKALMELNKLIESKEEKKS